MITSRILWIRALFVLTAFSLLVFGQVLHERASFEKSIGVFKDTRLDIHLRSAFPMSLFGNQSGIEPDRSEIERRIHEFNQNHWNQPREEKALRVRVIHVGPVQNETPAIGSAFPFSVRLASQPTPIEVGLIADASIGIPIGDAIFASCFLLTGLALALLLPTPASMNAFPVARDMALIFDRKVSAGQSWGIYRLSHLGGGGPLPGISENDFEACNNRALRIQCFSDVSSTYASLRSKLANSINSPQLRHEYILALEDGFRAAKDKVSDQAPWIESEEDVAELFWPFVRQDVLGFAILHFVEQTRVAKKLGLDPKAVSVERAPLWLIGGFEVYYPSILFDRLVDEIRAGLVSAYGRSFDSARILAESEHPFVSIQFICTGLAITPENESRLTKFVQTPFEGGLKRICALMAGSGDVLIYDARVGFQLVQRERSSARTDKGLILRLDFRRIEPSELESVRKRFTIRQ